MDHAKTFSMNWAKKFPKQERHTRVTWGQQICVHTPHLAIPSQMLTCLALDYHLGMFLHYAMDRLTLA